jgi:hypothetical protein
VYWSRQNHGKIQVDPPEDWLAAAGILDVYRDFYNHDRANQSLACGNRPPYEGFPNLPVLPHFVNTNFKCPQITGIRCHLNAGRQVPQPPVQLKRT